jgi:hypothetical protein
LTVTGYIAGEKLAEVTHNFDIVWCPFGQCGGFFGAEVWSET